MMKFLTRWREVKDEAEFEVVETPTDTQTAAVAAELLNALDRRPDREKPTYPGVLSLEGDDWTVHAANGTVYLSGEGGLVQVQFPPVDAYSLGTLLQQASQR
jgi:hypothetical protein